LASASGLTMQPPLFIEEGAKYTVKYRGHIVDVWRVGNQWMTDSYHVCDESKLEVMQRLGTPSEIFN